MKSILSTILSVVLFISCAHTQDKNFKTPIATSQKPAAGEAVAYFAEGCFWHTEIVFQSLVGVRDAVSGYAGGNTGNPTYEEVSGGSTGHAEAVKVIYDPGKISFSTLVAAFFASQDPTTLNKQGNDVGTEYRSIAFYSNESEKQVIEAEIKKLTLAKKYKNKIVTEVLPFKKFYNGEDYHQEYVSKHLNNPYIQNVSIPDYQKFRKEFKGNFKQ
ncbi:MAG: peptide-methionine (S)-S-oxide reductase MsrA [Ferruginibacter sp.]